MYCDLCTVPHSTYRYGNYSREETIHGQKLYVVIPYIFLIKSVLGRSLGIKLGQNVFWGRILICKLIFVHIVIEWPLTRIHSYDIMVLTDQVLSRSNVQILGDATDALTTITTSPKQNWDAVLLFFQIKCQDNLDWILCSLINLLTNGNAMQIS